MAKNTVYVYKGLGNSEQSLSMLTKTIHRVLHGTSYKCQHITPQEILKDDWLDHAALLAIGGGYDRGFIRALGEEGMAKIRYYVLQGGSYLGICAGGYFGCSHVEFAKGGPLEVCGERPLKFFQGNCIGPTFPDFEYGSEKGAHAAKTSWNISDMLGHDKAPDQENFCYFNGGGSFHEMEACKSDQTDITYEYKILATYAELPGTPAAAVRCRIGNGRAVLTGVHLEYVPEDLDPEDPHLQNVLPKLFESAKSSEVVLRAILKYLGLTI